MKPNIGDIVSVEAIGEVVGIRKYESGLVYELRINGNLAYVNESDIVAFPTPETLLRGANV